MLLPHIAAVTVLHWIYNSRPWSQSRVQAVSPSLSILYCQCRFSPSRSKLWSQQGVTKSFDEPDIVKVNIISMAKVRQTSKNRMIFMTGVLHVYKPQVTTGNLCCIGESHSKEEGNSAGPGNCSTAVRKYQILAREFWTSAATTPYSEHLRHRFKMKCISWLYQQLDKQSRFSRTCKFRVKNFIWKYVT